MDSVFKMEDFFNIECFLVMFIDWVPNLLGELFISWEKPSFCLSY